MFGSGLTYGKNYVFDGKRLDVQEDGTAVGEFNSTDGSGDVYYIPLLEINAGEQTKFIRDWCQRSHYLGLTVG